MMYRSIPHMQIKPTLRFIISHSSCAEQYGDMYANTQIHPHTHTHTHSHTNKPLTAGVQLVGHTSTTLLFAASLASTGTTYSTLPTSLAQQLYHTEVTEVLLVSDQHGYGFSLNAGAFPSDLLTEPPVINQVSENSAAERFVVFCVYMWQQCVLLARGIVGKLCIIVECEVLLLIFFNLFILF